MPEDEKNKGGEEGEEPKVNAFGEDIGATEDEGEGEGEAPKTEKKDDANDITKHPAFVELKTMFDEYKRTTGENLSNQGKIIEELRKGGGGGKKEDDSNALFKEVKRVKDLPEEEQEAMTETEKRLYDQNADMQDAMNRMFADASKKTETNAEDRNKSVRTLASALAKASAGKEDTELTNQIIENFNLFDQSKIPADKLEEFVQKAAAQVGGYKPPREQGSVRGGANKGATQAKEDPFGVDKIVEEAHKSTGGGGYSL